MLPSYKTVPTDWRFRVAVKLWSFVYDCCIWLSMFGWCLYY